MHGKTTPTELELTQASSVHARRFGVLGEAWLASGATSFEVYVGETCIWRTGDPHGPGSSGSQSTLSCQQDLGPSRTLHLRVGGVSGPAALRRLTVDAQLVAEAVRLDDELRQMTGELIDAQDQLLALYGLAKATRRRLSLDAVLAELVAEVSRLTGAELAFAALSEAAGGRLVVYPDAGSAHEAALWQANAWVDTSRAALIANTPLDLPPDLDPSGFVDNLVVVPVSVEGTQQATLGVVNRRDTTFSAGTVKLLQALGEQAGALVETALLHEQSLIQDRLRRDMELAAAIQAGLMADAAPLVPGVQVVGRFRPAREVGGDFYHHRLRPDGQLTFSVGDVSGKGLSAALIMGMSRNVLRGASQFLDGPCAVLEQVNADLYDDLNRVHTFVTAFQGYYDPRRRRVRFANAGHSPVIYCAVGDSPRLLPATALPLGVFPESSSTEESVRLDAGDVLVVATDGFSEATSPSGAAFGYERLMDLVRALAAESADAIADGLFAAITEFGQGTPQDDDQTLLVVKGR
ncbi:MAG: SpoIIE family protein phosphatase [Chloroflexi bacterium]|nr:SpoIIE family protein phosphatase [Chloroflexota bacterium]